MVVALPLLHPEMLQHLAPAPPILMAPPAPVPPSPRVVVHNAQETSAPSAPASAQLIQATGHSMVDSLLRPVNGVEAPPGVVVNTAMMSGSSAPEALAAGAATGRPAVSVARSPARLTLSTGVSAGLLLAPIQPVYPAIARMARVEGSVVIHAIISKTGTIESASVISGPTMLQGAALEAVRAARYRPYQLNGEPTEVETTFSINFRMSSSN